MDQTKSQIGYDEREFPVSPPEFFGEMPFEEDSRTYVLVPKHTRTADMAIYALKHRAFGVSVAAILRETPAKSKTDEVLEVAYEELKKERAAGPLSALSVSRTAGKVTDKKFAKYIAQREQPPAEASVDKAGSCPAGSYTSDDLRGIYQELYNMNLEGATDEYLEYYKKYGPSVALTPNMERDDILSALRHLVGELYDDMGDEDELNRWLAECGASAELRELL